MAPKQRIWQSLPATLRADLPAVIADLQTAGLYGDPQRVELYVDGKQVYGSVEELGPELRLGDWWGLRRAD